MSQYIEVNDTGKRLYIDKAMIMISHLNGQCVRGESVLCQHGSVLVLVLCACVCEFQ